MSHVFLDIPFFMLLHIVNPLSVVINDNITPTEGMLGYEDLINATIAIMKCLPRGAEFTVLLGGQYDDFQKRAYLDIVPLVLIAESNPRFNGFEKYTLTKYSFTKYQSYHCMQCLRKAHRFVLIASSQPILRSILQRTKDSPWANSDGFYVLIDRRTEQRGCINAHRYLWTAWTYDLLSVVFLCLDPNDGIVYYTFNPYSNSAPASWHEVGRSKGRHGHPWILFKRKYVKDRKALCEDLKFDKTTDLNRYHIRLNAIEMQPYVHIEPGKSGLDRYTGESSEILKVIFQKLNSLPKIHVLHNVTTYAIGGINSNGIYEGMMTALSSGTIDISLNSIPTYSYWKLRFTYPHLKTGLCAISHLYEMPMFTRIKMFMSMALIIGISMICAITFVVLWKREGCAKAALQVIRIVIGVGILRPPRIISARIFVCTVFIVFLNVNVFFQSHWAALLTIPSFYSNVDTPESIKKAGYTLYGPSTLREFINDPVLRTRFHGVTYRECEELVMNSSSNICIEDCLHTNYRIINTDNLYKSQVLRLQTLAFVTREDWPLYARVNQILRKMGEFGLIQKLRRDSLFNFKLKSKQRDTRERRYKPLSMQQLKFIFYLLAGGYACSIVIFMAELTCKCDSRPRNRRKIFGEGRKRNVASMRLWR